MNIYKVCTYVTILKAKRSSMKYIYINGYVNQTISVYGRILNFERYTMNYIYIYCFYAFYAGLNFSFAFNVCNFVLFGLYLCRCFLHTALLYIKQDIRTMQGMLVFVV